VRVQDDRLEDLLGPGAALICQAFDVIPDAIGLMWPVRDDTGRIVDFELGYTNPAAERLMGVALSQEVGARMTETMPSLMADGDIFDRVHHVAETGESDSAEIELDGMWRDEVHVRGTWIHTVLPFGDSVLSMAIDVSEERLRERELRNFAALAAHDLREPLMGLDVMVRLLAARGDSFGAEERELVQMLGEGTGRAKRLIDGILEYATVGDSDRREDVSCDDVLQDVTSALALRIEESAARVEVAPLPVVPGHREELYRVFQNLMANALKFHADDPPAVHVSAARRDDWWDFTVRDNGIGLGDNAEIFEMFSRGGNGGDASGSGIGLAVCRRIVEGHGGHIWAESAPGGGSMFTFALPAS
jgi:signal transduction histidine kinase